MFPTRFERGDSNFSFFPTSFPLNLVFFLKPPPPPTQPASATSQALVALSALHGRDLSKALLLLERRAVSLFVGEPSGRRLASVSAGGGSGAGAGGSSSTEHHSRHSTLSPLFCSCESFFFDVVGKGEKPACKHLIAAEIAEALAERKAGRGRKEQQEEEEEQQQQQQLPSSSSSPSHSSPVSPLAAFAPAPTVVPDDVLARLLIAG